MSYCRFSEGDVYVYKDAMGGFTCAACALSTSYSSHGLPHSQNFTTRAGLYGHLLAHEDAGHDVPNGAFVRLREEMECNK